MAINMKGKPLCAWLKPYTVVKISGIEARSPKRTAKLKDTDMANDTTMGSVKSIRTGRKSTTVIMCFRSMRLVGLGGRGVLIAFALLLSRIFLYVSFVNKEKRKAKTAKNNRVHSTHRHPFRVCVCAGFNCQSGDPEQFREESTDDYRFYVLRKPNSQGE
jgi:hypothetical protein